MKKKIIKAICVALAVLSCFCGVSCKKDSSNGKTIVEPQQKASYEGTHIYTAPETDDYLVQNGKTEYVLIVDSNATGAERTAKEESGSSGRCDLFAAAGL